MIDHKYGNWSVTKEATRKEAGEEQRTCSSCAEVETREIPALGGVNPVVIVVIVVAALGAAAVVVMVLKKKK